MQFKKTRQVMGEVIDGDYCGYDTGALYQLLQAIDPDIQLLHTDASTQHSFTVICKPEHEDAVRAIVKDHGSEASVAARLKAQQDAEHNVPIVQAISSLESKTFRAIREQIINTAIAVPDLDSCTTIEDIKAWLKANFALESWKEGKETKTIQDFDNAIKTERSKLK